MSNDEKRRKCFNEVATILLRRASAAEADGFLFHAEAYRVAAAALSSPKQEEAPRPGAFAAVHPEHATNGCTEPEGHIGKCKPAPDARPRATCGHVAYRGHTDTCIQDGCGNVAYQVMVPVPAPERRETHAFEPYPNREYPGICSDCARDPTDPIHTQPDPGGAR